MKKKTRALKVIARGPQAEARGRGGGQIEGCLDPACKENG